MGTKNDILGFTFDGIEKNIWSEIDKRDAILTIMKGWVKASEVKRSGIPFAEFQSVTSKLRHAFISIPAGKGLISPCNEVLRKEPKFVYLHQNKRLQHALKDARTLLRESTLAPTKCMELVANWPDFVGVKDASGHGVGGIIVDKNITAIKKLVIYICPTPITNNMSKSTNVFLLKWAKPTI